MREGYEWPTFVCDGCGEKATACYDENILEGEVRRLCDGCASALIEKERVFLSHVPGCVDAPHHMIRFSTWDDLERKLREGKPWMSGHRIGCDYCGKGKTMLLDVFDSDEGVQWWVLGAAYNGPGNPPWESWKAVVRELGGSV